MSKLNYKDFRKNMLIAVDFGECSMNEIEEVIQEWYITYKSGSFSDIISFCSEQIPTDRDNSALWLSERGIAILELIAYCDRLKFNRSFPIA